MGRELVNGCAAQAPRSLTALRPARCGPATCGAACSLAPGELVNGCAAQAPRSLTALRPARCGPATCGAACSLVPGELVNGCAAQAPRSLTALRPARCGPATCGAACSLNSGSTSSVARRRSSVQHGLSAASPRKASAVATPVNRNAVRIAASRALKGRPSRRAASAKAGRATGAACACRWLSRWEGAAPRYARNSASWRAISAGSCASPQFTGTTTCSPRSSDAGASASARAANGVSTIALAAVTIPFACASSMPWSMAGSYPRSSAFTISSIDMPVSSASRPSPLPPSRLAPPGCEGARR